MSTIAVVKDDLETGNFRLSVHARQRMSERNVTVRDIQVCAYRDGTLIVTVK